MPIPKPAKGEQQKPFIARCMKVVSKTDSSRPQAVQLAMCYSSWRKARKITETFCIGCIMSKIKDVLNKIRKKNESPGDMLKFKLSAMREQFFSLDSALRKRVDKAYGNENYIADFSNKEVIFRNQDMAGGDYHKIRYKIVKKDIELIGAPELVSKAVNYEKELEKEMSMNEFAHLVTLNNKIRYIQQQLVRQRLEKSRSKDFPVDAEPGKSVREIAQDVKRRRDNE